MHFSPSEIVEAFIQVSGKQAWALCQSVPGKGVWPFPVSVKEVWFFPVPKEVWPFCLSVLMTEV